MMTVKRRSAETLRRIHAGRLPMLAGASFLLRSGHGDGRPESSLCCDGCDDPIAQYERCYEVPRPTAASLNFHSECFTAERPAQRGTRAQQR
jgi:hypothetical protein